MNILFVVHGLYPCAIGGVEIFYYYLIKSLSEIHRIFILTFCKKTSDLDKRVVKVVVKKIISKRTSFTPMQDFIAIAKMRHKIDVIHVCYMGRDWFRWFPFPLLKKMFDIPYVITIHGGGMYPWKPDFIHKFFFKHASAIAGVSPEIKKEYEKRSNREILLIPSLIPFKECLENREGLRIKYGFDKKNKIIISVGSIKKIKGSHILLDAFINLGIEYIAQHNLTLLFVGEGKMKEKLKEKAIKSGFTRQVVFLGNIYHDKIPELYKISDIYVIASFFEGCPKSLLEAMFNSLAVIGADTVGINSIVKNGENGLLFKAGDSRDLKNQIRKMVEGEVSMQTLGSNAKSFYKSNYKLEAVVKSYINIFRNIKNNTKV